MTTRILIFVAFLLVGYGIGWSGGFVIGVKPDSRLQWTMDRIHLMAILLVALIILLMPPMTGFYGAPVLAYASVAALILSLPLFSLRMPYPVNVLSPAKGDRAKPLSEQQRTSRWPFSLAWTTGYLLAGLYVWTIYRQYG